MKFTEEVKMENTKIKFTDKALAFTKLILCFQFFGHFRKSEVKVNWWYHSEWTMKSDCDVVKVSRNTANEKIIEEWMKSDAKSGSWKITNIIRDGNEIWNRYAKKTGA